MLSRITSDDQVLLTVRCHNRSVVMLSPPRFRASFTASSRKAAQKGSNEAGVAGENLDSFKREGRPEAALPLVGGFKLLDFNVRQELPHFGGQNSLAGTTAE